MSQPPQRPPPSSLPPGQPAPAQRPSVQPLQVQMAQGQPPQGQPPQGQPPQGQPPQGQPPQGQPQTVKTRFHRVAHTQEEEDAYDLVANRHKEKPSGTVASVAHLIKGALGAGILSGHVAYNEAGAAVALPLNILLGVYLTYTLYVLGTSAQVLYKRTNIPSLTYPEVGEAALSCHPSNKVKKLARVFRYFMDFVICVDLYGCCCCYQLIISKSVKQIVENTQSSLVGPAHPGGWGLRAYLCLFAVPCACICLIRHLQVLAPFSIIGNFLVLVCICVTIYYCFEHNPTFSGMKSSTDFAGTFKFLGMIVFSMSCSGIVLAVENNMKDPNKYPLALLLGMIVIVISVIVSSFFGYAAYLDKSVAPITLNFPMTLLPKILKALIAMMIYMTHAVNYWVPFNLTYQYIKPFFKPEQRVKWEYLFRFLIALLITCVAVIFPDISKVMSFLGTFCLSNMAFIWPCIIYLLNVWDRPGLGKLKWRLWKCVFLIMSGLILFIAGSLNNIKALLSLFVSSEQMIDENVEEIII